MKYIDLTHTLLAGIPSFDGTPCYKCTVAHDYKDSVEPNLFRVQLLTMKAGSGTHIDAPAHCFPGAKTIDHIDLADLVAPCVVIDVSEFAGAEYVADASTVLEFEKTHGQISTGNFIIFYTGWSSYWDDPERYRNSGQFPSIGEDAARLLIERGVVGVGIDTLSPDSGEDFPVHRAMLGAGKYIVENVANAGQLPATGTRVYISPIKIGGGTEAPVRMYAEVV